MDATKESGRLGRLINHSKTGNCQTKLHPIDGTPHLILVASRDIDAEEELLYDYGDRSKASVMAHPWLKYWTHGCRCSYFKWIGALCCPLHLHVKYAMDEQPSTMFYKYKNDFVLNGGSSFNTWKVYFFPTVVFYDAFIYIFLNRTVADWCKLEENFSWISNVSHCPGGFLL